MALEEIEDPELVAFSKRSYAHCVRWFGPPEDEEWPVELFYGSQGGCLCSRITRMYAIVIRRTYKSQEARKATLAHEMYHRTTMRKKSLKDLVWVDEMLAFLAMENILRAEGLSEFADYQIQCQQVTPAERNLTRLHKVKRRHIPFTSGHFQYPADFGPAVACLGVELEALIGWPLVWRLANCGTWTDWFHQLPPDSRLQVSALLGINIA